jgi:hypothetical protein
MDDRSLTQAASALVEQRADVAARHPDVRSLFQLARDKRFEELARLLRHVRFGGNTSSISVIPVRHQVVRAVLATHQNADTFHAMSQVLCLPRAAVPRCFHRTLPLVA